MQARVNQKFAEMATPTYHDPAVAYIMAGKLKLENKDGVLVTFVPSPIQVHVLELIEWFRENQMAVRLIILKARQIGATTVIAAYLYATARIKSGQSIIVAGNDGDSCGDIWDQKYRKYFENDAENPKTERNSMKELKFADTQSKINIRIGGPDLGRGGTRQHCHLTELPFFKDPERSWAVLKPCLPDTPNTSIFWESTASNPNDLFERQFYAAQKAQEEEDESFGWRAVFFPWTAQEEYQIVTLSESFKEKLQASLDDYEKALQADGITLNQIAWRRKTEKELGEDEFRKAYPYTPQEAFESRRNSIFTQRTLRWYQKHYLKPPERKTIPYLRSGRDFRIANDSEGPLHIWQAPNPNLTYTIAADPASEHDSASHSKSAASVICNETGTIVATYIEKLDEEDFADAVMAIGYYYNEAFLVPETNKGGGLMMRLKQRHYPRIYRRAKKIDSLGGGTQGKLGMHMDSATRDWLIARTQAMINQKRVRFFCERLFAQMQTFVEISGKIKAQSGNRDDLMVATCMAIGVASEDHDWDELTAEGLAEKPLEKPKARVLAPRYEDYLPENDDLRTRDPLQRVNSGGSIYA